MKNNSIYILTDQYIHMRNYKDIHGHNLRIRFLGMLQQSVTN